MVSLYIHEPRTNMNEMRSKIFFFFVACPYEFYDFIICIRKL